MFNCLNCNLEQPDKKNTYNKYCNNKCQAEHKQIPFDLLLTDGTRKKRLLKVLVYECSVCKISEWNGKPLGLEMDHIDGNPYNNLFENLRLICPNCHSQTPTYKAKNKGFGRKHRNK